jgi:Caspase domain
MFNDFNKMKLKRFFISIMVLLTLHVFELSAQQNYKDISAGQRVSILSETFDNNNNNWITDNSYISGKFVNGNFDIACKNFNNNTGLSYRTVQLDQSKDFELETSFTIIKGSGALVFGLTKDFDHYRVEISDNKNLIICKNTPSKGKVDKLFSGKEEMLINDIGFYNKITVRKYEGVYYIFVNDILIKQFNNITLAGDQVGFNVGLNSEISVDYLNVSYIQPQTKPVLAEKNVVKTDTSKIIAAVKPAPKDTLKIISPPKDTLKIAAAKRDSINLIRQNVVPVLPPASAPATATLIAWVSPSGLTTILDSYQNTVKVRVSISSPSAVRSAQFYVNGAARGEGDIRPGENGTSIAEKVITLNPGDNNVYLVATGVDGSSKMSDTRYFTNPFASMPEIKWRVPFNAIMTANTEKITLEVCIKSGADLASANVWVNGNQFTVARVFQRLNNDSCNYIWRPQVILKEGDNSVFVNAENSAGSVPSENRIIKFVRGIAEKRLALVIGNSDYNTGTSLKNPTNDANLMEAHLKNLGFTVIKQLNCRKDSMLNAIKDFSRKLNDYNVALFYYAGHGVQVDGVNYLIPVDAKLEHKEDVSFDAIPVTMVTDQLKRNSANTNIVILDACRNNPYKAWARGGNEGFKALGPVNGTIISFATSEGATASDGDGNNGLFTQELVKQMEISQPITNVFINTRKEVYTKTNGQQMPTEWNYLLTTDFSFKK